MEAMNHVLSGSTNKNGIKKENTSQLSVSSTHIPESARPSARASVYTLPTGRLIYRNKMLGY